MMRKIKDSLKSKFAQSLVTTSGDSQKVEIEYPKDAISKYIRLYGMEEFIDNLPDTVTLFEIVNSENNPLNLQLPQSFKKFKNLGTFFARNAVNEVPDVLKGMQELNFIALPDNPNITEVPEWIADLPNLIALTFFGGNPDLKIGPKVQAKMDNEEINVMY